jgi:hypothetical protein
VGAIAVQEESLTKHTEHPVRHEKGENDFHWYAPGFSGLTETAASAFRHLWAFRPRLGQFLGEFA